jgi:crotonobetainyl-CoA:carnitine CoA-transferase CaiB-like acyl-CoA transferase
LKQELQTIFSQRDRADWQRLLGDADCCFSVIAAPSAIHENEQFKARGALGRFDDGTTWLRSPLRISDHTPEIINDIPGYGEHTREVLSAAGYSDDEIDGFAVNGVVK